MVADLGIAESPASVGYYSGLSELPFHLQINSTHICDSSVESSFAITQLLFIYHWSRLSDRIGRRPVLCFGLLGVSLSVGLFGLSRSLWGMIAARCCAGMLSESPRRSTRDVLIAEDGNPAVIKAALGEISNKGNEGRAFAYL